MEKEEAPSSPSSPSLNPSAPLSPLNFQWRDPSLFFSLPRGAVGVGVGVCAKATNCAGGDNGAAAPSLPFRFTLLLSSEHRSEPANAPPAAASTPQLRQQRQHRHVLRRQVRAHLRHRLRGLPQGARRQLPPPQGRHRLHPRHGGEENQRGGSRRGINFFFPAT